MNQLQARASSVAVTAEGLRKGLDKDSQIEALREELESERTQAASRLQELKFEIDRLRKAKQDLECGVAAVDMKVLNEESEEVKRLREELAEVRTAPSILVHSRFLPPAEWRSRDE